jgi:hypothetical protein
LSLLGSQNSSCRFGSLAFGRWRLVARPKVRTCPKSLAPDIRYLTNPAALGPLGAYARKVASEGDAMSWIVGAVDDGSVFDASGNKTEGKGRNEMLQ